MTSKAYRPRGDAELRRQAEDTVREKKVRTPEELEVLSPEETLRLLHELQVHQIELEMQNEELRRTQAELDAARVRYFDLYDLAPVGYCTISEKGLILEANLTAANLLGVAKNRLVKQPLSRFIVPEEQGIYYLHSKKLFETGAPQACELRMVKKDGTAIWTHLADRAAHDAKGEPVSNVVISDISERKQLEEERFQSERHNSLLHETMLQGVVYQDAEGKIISMNPAAVRILGKGPEEFAGHTSESMEHPTLRADGSFLPGLDHPSMVALRTGQELRDVVMGVYNPRERDYRWINVRAMPLFRPGEDTPYQVYIIFDDITERKRVEEDRKKLEDHLRYVKKMEAIGILAGGIAHEFNNLLMGIQGHASLMMLDIDTSHPNYKRLKHIEEQVQSGADLTKQLLGFSREGRYEVKPKNMNDIIVRTSSMYGRTKREVTIHRSLSEDLWIVEIDQGQMEQVFMNLFMNAWQAMPRGGEIDIGTENVILDEARVLPDSVKPGKYVKITVTDTGTGMDAKTMERIFDPFFTTKAMGRGTGLGLATVYGIIKGHRGMIDVDSTPGQGTTFTIYLPASEREVVKKKMVSENIFKGTGTILLVDDEKMVIEVNREILESLGYRVYVADSGQEAIAVYMEKRNEFDLVILDMIMPGISGGETFDSLRKINPKVKVLLCSGYIIAGQAREILNRGCNGFIQKPFRLEELSSKVREILEQDRSFQQ